MLTCQLHGWRFDLATGRCLNSDGDYHLEATCLETESRVGRRTSLTA